MGLSVGKEGHDSVISSMMQLGGSMQTVLVYHSLVDQAALQPHRAERGSRYPAMLAFSIEA